MEDLEKRMYFFVPYNISDVQKGIQSGHAALEYAKKYGHTDLFKDFMDNHKIWIILNGGTTNNEFELGTGKPLGTLNEIMETLISYNINFSYFYEPDLNNALTAICLIVDERVFNRKSYPDFDEYFNNLKQSDYDVDIMYQYWLNMIGGDKIKILRDLINNKKLA